ncbi:MAG TPA: hypothetical protein VM240_13530 [Verrucomicrobiae bacterium]|nr:hypothetical protein [Verrucomicrobiae bacterium]
MVLLAVIGVVAAVVIGTVVMGINDFSLKRYNYATFSALSTFWVGVASLALFVGFLEVPEELLLHQEPMTPAEVASARAALATELAEARELAKTSKDLVDKANAQEEVKRLAATKVPSIKDVYTLGNVTQYFQWPIPGSLKSSLYCVLAALAILIGIFVNNGVKTNWIIAFMTLVVQVAVCATVVLFLALVYFWKAYKRNKGL